MNNQHGHSQESGERYGDPIRSKKKKTELSRPHHDRSKVRNSEVHNPRKDC